MDFSSEVYDIIAEAFQQHPNDINACADAAEQAIRAMEGFEDMVALHISRSVKHLVYDYRGRINMNLRRQTGEYGQPAKVDPASPAVRQVYAESWYLYCIGRKTLGELLGSELPDVVTGERTKAEGHLFNVALLEYLAQRVPDDKRVRDVFSERQLARLAKKLQRGPELQAAAQHN